MIHACILILSHIARPTRSRVSPVLLVRRLSPKERVRRHRAVVPRDDEAPPLRVGDDRAARAAARRAQRVQRPWKPPPRPRRRSPGPFPLRAAALNVDDVDVAGARPDDGEARALDDAAVRGRRARWRRRRRRTRRAGPARTPARRGRGRDAREPCGGAPRAPGGAASVRRRARAAGARVRPRLRGGWARAPRPHGAVLPPGEEKRRRRRRARVMTGVRPPG